MTRSSVGWVGALCTVGSLLVSVACDGGADHTRNWPPNSSYSACQSGRPAGQCLRFLNRVVVLKSLELTADVPSRVTATCAEMVPMTRLHVICPPLVPAGGVVGDHALYGPQIVDRRSYSMSINNGDNQGRVHWEIGAITGPARALWVFDRANWDALPPRRPAELIGQRRYLGHTVTLYRFPDSDGQLEGHDAAFATKHAVTYFVSIHGHNHDDADIAMLLAVLACGP